VSKIIFWLVVRSITSPLATTTTLMTRMAGGEDELEVPHQTRSDEIGSMARALEMFKETVRKKVASLVEEQTRQQNEAAQTQRKSREEMASKFEANVKNVVDMVASAATEMEATSKSVTHIVDTNKNKLKALSVQIEGTSRNVQTVSSTTSQLSAAITEITQQVARATAVTTNAVQEATKADGTVQTLTAAAQKIGTTTTSIFATFFYTYSTHLGSVWDALCHGTSQGIRLTYRCPCPKDLGQPCRCT